MTRDEMIDEAVRRYRGYWPQANSGIALPKVAESIATVVRIEFAKIARDEQEQAGAMAHARWSVGA